jgi:hypothetical protein
MPLIFSKIRKYQHLFYCMLYSIGKINSDHGHPQECMRGLEHVVVPPLIPAGEAAAALGSATFHPLLVSVAAPFLANNSK